MEDVKLTVKQKKFADEYIKSGNATQSYTDAGYSVKNDNAAGVEGHKLLRNPKIQSYIDIVNKKLDDESIADMIEIKRFWTDTVRGKHIEMKDRIKASELIAKTNGAFIDKVEQSGEIGLKVEWLDEDTT